MRRAGADKSQHHSTSNGADYVDTAMTDRVTANPMPQRTIGDHGIIGNLKTAALVAMDGTIDFMCWPQLDSPTVFAALLDPEKGGEFSVGPKLDGTRTIQMYLPATNLLVTRSLAVEGSAEITDLMPYPNAKGEIERSLIRRVAATRGRIDFSLRCRPRFDYARIVPETKSAENGVIFTEPRSDIGLHLCGCVPIVARDGEATAQFTLNQGDQVYFVLRDVGAEVYRRDEIEACVLATIDAWQQWANRSTYAGRWRERVTRSALALKLLVSHEYGSIAAAATFGLPEASGAGRKSTVGLAVEHDDGQVPTQHSVCARQQVEPVSTRSSLSFKTRIETFVTSYV